MSGPGKGGGMKRSILVLCLGIVLGTSVFADVGGALPGFAGGKPGDPFAAMEGQSLSSMEELAAIVGARPEPYYYEEAEERAEDPDREELRHFLHAKAVSRRLVTQYDLRNCKVKDWNQACKFLTLISGPQIDSGNIWDEKTTIQVIKMMKSYGWIRDDFYVENANAIIDYTAKFCGYFVGGRDWALSKGTTERYWEMIGYTGVSKEHTVLFNADGLFIWDPYYGGENSLKAQLKHRSICFD